MNAVVASVIPCSPAERAHIASGEILLRVNGNTIIDVLDYKYYTYDRVLLLELQRPGGTRLFVRVKKRAGEELGLEFTTFLIDGERGCANRCIFCFVDQLPRGMRPSLYYKDDDTRLSFLHGNYVTLTNLSEREIQRIIDLKISPLRVSVHTMNPELRAFMLGNPRGAEGVAVIKHLAQSGITLECQIVVCPGVNDGAELDFTMRELSELHPGVESVSVVPVGLTRHRENLHPLVPFDAYSARETVAQVEAFAEKCLQTLGTRLFFCADELYLKAELPLPDDAFYEGYPQLNNGVGMLRLLTAEFEDALEDCETDRRVPFTAVTGVSAAPFLEKLLCTAREKCGTIQGEVIAVKNAFFGESVDVAGLVVGADVIAALRKRPPQSRILLPRNMLRHGETVFLDDVSVADVEREFGATVRVVEQDGADLLRAMLGY